MLQSLAESIARHGLTVPAVFVLELVRPFAFLCGQALRVSAPLLDSVTRQAPSRYAQLLEEPGNVETLIGLLENSGARPAGRGG